MHHSWKLLPACCFLFFIFTTSCRSEQDGEVDKQKFSDSLKASVAGNEYEKVDQSPLDISYYPTDFTQHKAQGNVAGTMPVARVIYSRPHKKGRDIFGDNPGSLCRYNVPWRLGANEATEIEFFKPVVINNKNIAAGRYVMYAIPYPDKWIIVLNSNIYSWGLEMDASKDIARTEVVTQTQVPPIEDFTMIFSKASYGADLLMAWDNVRTFLPITFTEM